MNPITPYLNFDGNCREAMAFYQECLGGTLDTMTFGESNPEAPPEAKDRLIHAYLDADHLQLMASDTIPGSEYKQGNSVWLSLKCESGDQVDRLYEVLSGEGQSIMAPHNAFWGARFAMFNDRFGVNWMLNFELPKT